MGVKKASKTTDNLFQFILSLGLGNAQALRDAQGGGVQ